MSLYYFHFVLIGATILGDLFFTLFCLQRYRADDNPAMLTMAAVSTIVTVAFVAYMVYFARHLSVVRHQLEKVQPCPACGYDLRGQRGTVRSCPECGCDPARADETGHQPA